MAGTSRWLVGSSRSSRDGWPTRARASSARRRHPPDRESTGASGGRRSVVKTRSTCCSTSQPPRSSSSWCTRPSASRASGVACSATRTAAWWYAVTTSRNSSRPSATTSKTVCDVEMAASCTSLAARRSGARQTDPASGSSSPDRSRSSVDLPAPLRPMTAMRSPASIVRLAWSSSGRGPKAMNRSSHVRIGNAPTVPCPVGTTDGDPTPVRSRAPPLVAPATSAAPSFSSCSSGAMR